MQHNTTPGGGAEGREGGERGTGFSDWLKRIGQARVPPGRCRTRGRGVATLPQSARPAFLLVVVARVGGVSRRCLRFRIGFHLGRWGWGARDARVVPHTSSSGTARSFRCPSGGPSSSARLAASRSFATFTPTAVTPSSSSTRNIHPYGTGATRRSSRCVMWCSQVSCGGCGACDMRSARDLVLTGRYVERLNREPLLAVDDGLHARLNLVAKELP